MQAAQAVTFLGTGCAEPSKLRGSAAIWLHLGSRRNLLLDCGEGAFGQMVHHWGLQGARNKVQPAEAQGVVWLPTAAHPASTRK